MPVNGQQQLSNAIDASVCGIMVELVQGEGGGLPIGAVLMDEQTENIFQPGHHGSTFGGNPVVCAGGIEVLKQVYNETFLSNVSDKGTYLKERLMAMPEVVDVSGLGLMLGVTLAKGLDARKVASRCAESGLLILTAKDKLRIMPPLNITKEEIDRGIDVLRKCLSEQAHL